MSVANLGLHGRVRAVRIRGPVAARIKKGCVFKDFHGVPSLCPSPFIGFRLIMNHRSPSVNPVAVYRSPLPYRDQKLGIRITVQEPDAQVSFCLCFTPARCGVRCLELPTHEKYRILFCNTPPSHALWSSVDHLLRLLVIELRESRNRIPDTLQLRVILI